MAFGFGFALTAIAKAVGFTPRSLFTSGEQGVWYDPSDMSTMFQDAAGTIPVMAVGQPVGKILDKSGRGNHATQTTATSRPVLSARVNLLTKTEQFDDAYWRLFGVASTTSSITEDTLTAVHEILSPDNLIVTGQVTTISIEAKAGTATHIQLTFTGGANPFANFDLVNGVVSLSGNSPISTTIVNAGNGYFRCTLTSSGTGSSGGGAVSICLIDNNPTATRRPLYAGTGKSAFIRKVDLRVANVGTNLPAYQRVNTATDYDTAGFPMYLSFDGVDDYLVTGSIDFTGTDKMTVFSGARKFTDASFGVICELSANADANASGFAFIAANATGFYASVGAIGNRTIAPQIPIPAAPASPSTSLMVVAYDRAQTTESEIQYKYNGAAFSSSGVAVQGTTATGNFGAFQLFIGRRGGTSLPFNGNLYGLIVRGAQSTAQQITQTEQWVNGKTRAY